MALIPNGSSQSQTPSNQQVTTSVATYLEQAPYIKDSLTQRTSYNPTTFDNQERYLIGWLDGMRVDVTYYRRVTTNTERKSVAIDNPMVRNAIHDQFECISLLEMTFSEGLQASYTEEQVEMGIRGDGWMYPGTNPGVGDQFLFPVTDGQILLFQITKVWPLTIRQERCFGVEFMATKFAQDADIQQLTEMTIKTWHFVKETFFTSNSVVLDSDSFLQQQTLQKMRPQLIKDYYRNFWSNDAVTFINSNGVYDPYLAKYMTEKISFDDDPRRATIVPPPNDDVAKNTIWSLLLDTDSTTINGLYVGYLTSLFVKYYTDTGINGLLNRQIIYVLNDSWIVSDNTNPNYGKFNNPGAVNAQTCLGPQPVGVGAFPDPTGAWGDPGLNNANAFLDGPFYVLSQAFYLGNTSGMTPFEQILYSAITTRNVADVNGFIGTYLNTYQTLSQSQKFYTIPLYLFMVDLALQSIVPNMPEGNGFQ